MQTKLSIYTAERFDKPLHRGAEGWNHSFSVLMDETAGTGKKANVIQNLHFVSRGSKLTAKLKHGRDGMGEGYELQHYDTGDVKSILPIWTHGLGFTLALEDKQLSFGKDFTTSRTAINCRAGTKALFKAMGFVFKNEFVKSVAGLDAEIDCDYPIFSSDNTITDLGELYAEYERLSIKLSGYSIHHPFLEQR